MAEAPAPSLTQLLKDLESPLEDVRVGALRGLAAFPSLAILRALRKVAGSDPAVPVRAMARQLLDQATGKLAIDTKEGPARLKALLTSPDPNVRARVVGALATSTEPEVPQVLAAALADEREPVVIGALLSALAAAGGAAFTGPIAAHLTSSDPRIRATAVEALEACGDKVVLARLLPLLDDPHHRVRAMVARAVQAHDREAVLACVDGMLRDPQEVVVRSALYVLRFFDGPVALPRLRDHLTAGPAAGQKMAIDSVAFLAKKGSAPAAQLLARLKEVLGPAIVPDANPDGSPVAAELPQRLLSDRQDVRVAAVREVVRTGRDELVPSLRARLAVDADPHVRATLVSALGRMGSTGDSELIRPFLKDRDDRLRANAVEAIGLLKPGSAVELLTPALNDPHHRVRANAVVALHFVPGNRALATLREMAWHQDPRHAASAIWAAATLATNDSVEVLAALCGAPSPEVAQRARAALTELAPVMKEAESALARVASGRVAPPSRPPAPIGGPLLPKVTAAPMPPSGARPAPGPATAPPPAPGLLRSGDRARLVAELANEAAPVRVQACKALAAGADAGLMPALRPLLQDGDAAVRRAAREAVRAAAAAARPTAGADALEAHEANLKKGPGPAKQVLDGILDIALTCGTGSTAAMLGRRLPGENDPFLRAQLVSSLALVGDASHVALIKAFLRDPDPRVRANAVDALDLVGTSAEKQEVVALLEDPDPRVRAAAITAALPVTREPFLSHLKGMLASAAVADRGAGLYALRSVEIPERFEVLRSYFRTETHPHLYEACADTLAREAMARGVLPACVSELPAGPKRQLFEAIAKRHTEAAEDPANAPSAAPAVDPEQMFSRYQHTLAAGELTPDALRKALSKATSAVDVAFLLEAAVQLKLPDVVDLSMPFTHSKDRRLRLAAAEALGKLKSPEASDMLSTLVRDRDSDISHSALRQLAGFDQAAALGCARDLVKGAPDAVVRGLEVLEQHGSKSDISTVLEVVERGAPPASAGVLSRLMSAWGDQSTLEHIVMLHSKATGAARAPLALLAAQLTMPLNMTAEQVAQKMAAPPAAPNVGLPKATGTTAALSRPDLRPTGRSTKKEAASKPPPPQSFWEKHKDNPQVKVLGGLIVVLALLVLKLIIF